jgi:cytochrome P450
MTPTEHPTLSGARALAVLADLALPSVAAGAILRRKPVVKILERTQADRRAIQRLRRLRHEFGGAPVLLDLKLRKMLVVTDPEDVGFVLNQSPSPFHPANFEKRKALSQFQPHGVLISPREKRTERRAVNEAALDTAAPLHRLAPEFARVIDEEARHLTERAQASGTLSAADFETGWWRLVRRLTLGDRARDDEAITDDLRRLRSAANWSFAALPHRRVRERFLAGLRHYAVQPDPRSLLGALLEIPADPGIDALGQVPQWLFAFDAANMATIRALAALVTHPRQLEHAMADAAEPQLAKVRPYLQGCVLESVRLWPTTPVLLRDVAGDNQSGHLEWGAAAGMIRVSRGTGVLITVPAFHRDRELLAFADDFEPTLWVDGRAQQYPQLVPFSAGPVECPGRNLVLFSTSTMLAQLLSRLEFRLPDRHGLSPETALPATLDQYGLRFAVRARIAAESTPTR